MASTRAQYPAAVRVSIPLFLFLKQRSSSQLRTPKIPLREMLN